ncbi:MAG: copper resistance CopC family protein [Chloroflexota bacterium]
MKKPMTNQSRLFFMLLLASSCLLIGSLFATTPAFAHVFLKSSQPAEDQVVMPAPTQVILVFSGDLQPTGNNITVTDAAGVRVDKGDTSSRNLTTLNISLKVLPSGVYTVNYSAASAADGHVTEGSYRFAVGAITLTPEIAGRACASLPTLTAQNQAASVRIVSPSDNSTVTTTLDYVLATRGFTLGSNGNYAQLWLDGQRAARVESDGGHSIELANGIHDLCVALVDGSTQQEVGARAGIRLVVRKAASQGNDTALRVILVMVSAVVGLLIIVWWWRRRLKALR